MKLVVAVIQPEKLDDVREALIKAGITRITVSRVTGHGRQEGESIYRGQKVIPDLIPKVKIEIAVSKENVPSAISAITQSAKTGRIGDGKVFVLPLEDCIRIRTGETGSSAL